ncbi:MAG: 30S ribosomal protein S16 [Planctomycetales bacterium]|nr:30S ribosomal protein S16 [Planctomycetales bacterium]
MKKMGRAHRAFFRICATEKRSPRDGRVLEELGTYDPSVLDTDARAILNKERVAYWLSVGAQPSDKVAVLIKKYTPGGTHEAAQTAALEKLSAPKSIPDPGPAVSKLKTAEEKAAEEAAEKAAQEKAAADAAAAEAEASAADEAPAEETPAEETPAADA